MSSLLSCGFKRVEPLLSDNGGIVPDLINDTTVAPALPRYEASAFKLLSGNNGTPKSFSAAWQEAQCRFNKLMTFCSEEAPLLMSENEVGFASVGF